MQHFKDVDAYIANAPKETQAKLTELRSFIKALVPTAEEKISYAMPFYSYKGRLVYFAVAKKHIGLYIPPPIIEDHQEDLKAYGTTKSAVHLPLDKELPWPLIEKLIQARMRHNEGMQKNK